MKTVQPVPTTTPEVLTDLLEELHKRVRGAISELSLEALGWIPDPGANSVGATIWHFTRWLDVVSTRLLDGGGSTDELWLSRSWAGRTGYDPRGLGEGGLGVMTGYTASEVAQIPSLSADQLLDYHDAVVERLHRQIVSLTAAQLAGDAPGWRVMEARAAAAGGRRPTYGWLKLILLGSFQHLGEALAFQAIRQRLGRPTTRDPVSEDASVDSSWPAAEILVSIPSHGHAMLGVQLVAAGRSPHPNVILLHGFPGTQRNFDMAETLCRAGWNVLVLHYRGSWGSEGAFSFGTVLEDTAAAVGHLREPAYQREHRGDGNRIVLVGHSMGGFAALITAAADRSVAAAASLAGFNFGAFSRTLTPDSMPQVARDWEGELPPLRGATGMGLVEEVRERGEAWELAGCASALAGRPVLLLAGLRDTTAPTALHHEPLVRALRGQGILTEGTIVAGHGFEGRRVELVRRVLGWLDNLAVAPPK